MDTAIASTPTANQPPTSATTTSSPGSSPVTPSASSSCPTCHITIRPTDYFCFNCGKALKIKPEPVSILSQLFLYLGSLLLPPLGYIWSIRYLRRPNRQAKAVGIVCIILTTISLVATVIVSIQLANSLNDQVNERMLELQGGMY